MPARGGVSGDGTAVSIRARPHGRAMRRSISLLVAAMGFQSAPGLTVGRCLAESGHGSVKSLVSIRARPHGRAMPDQFVSGRARHLVSIRARPHGRAMREADMIVSRDDWFQSAPGLTVGRCKTADKDHA